MNQQKEIEKNRWIFFWYFEISFKILHLFKKYQKLTQL